MGDVSLSPVPIPVSIIGQLRAFFICSAIAAAVYSLRVCNCTLHVQVIYEHLQLAEHLPIKNCDEFYRFVTTCAQLAWSLTVQRPPYVLEYQLRGAVFDDDRHRRFHTSDSSSTDITHVVWPGLVEQSTGFCVSKAVVVT